MSLRVVIVMFPKGNNRAVSPVIGVILMVAITVLLVAFVSAFVFGMASHAPDMIAVGASARQVQDTIRITYHGGPDHNLVDSLTIYVTDSDGTPQPAVNIGPPANIGLMHECTGTNGMDHVIVVAHAANRESQVILDTLV
jgi:flagellin-like protein